MLSEIQPVISETDVTSEILVIGEISDYLDTIVFDVNGPLLEKTAGFYGQLRINEIVILANLLGWDINAAWEFIEEERRTIGTEAAPAPINQVLEKWESRLKYPELIEKLENLRIQAFPFEKIKPDPNTAKILTELNQRYRLVFASNNPSAATKEVLKRLGFTGTPLGHQITIVGPDKINFIAKPSSEYFPALAGYCGLTPEDLRNSIVIGDDFYKEGFPALQAGFRGAILIQKPSGLPSVLEVINQT